MDAQLFPLFPTPVASYRLGRDFTDNEMAFMRQCLQDLTPNEGNTTSVFRRVLDTPDMADLRKFCLESIRHYAAQVMQVDDGEATFTQSWLNLSKKGQWHHAHKHPNSIWSAVLYVVVGDGDRIMFHKHDYINGSFQLAEIEWNQYNSRTWWLPVHQGELIVFPSQLTHSVPPTESEERISLSFNTFATKHIGRNDALTGLTIEEL